MMLKFSYLYLTPLLLLFCKSLLAVGTAGPILNLTEKNWQLPDSHWVSAKTPLQIVQPQANLDTRNRFYKAYPGIQYHVKAAVRGGAFPYFYELTAAPAGMTIDSLTGIIKWDKPISRKQAYEIKLRVSDQASVSKVVSWPLQVTEDGFIFVDAINGNDNNNGSFKTPYRTINGWYKNNKYDKTHENNFVYYMNGRYRTIDAPLENNYRMACVNHHKPTVHLAYPGHTPIIDVLNSHWIFYSGNNNVYFQGFTWENIDQPHPSKGKQNALVIESSGQNVTLYRNSFNGGINRNLGGRNPAMIFISKHKPGKNWAITNNQFNNVVGVAALLSYNLESTLIAENTIHNMHSGAAVGLYIKISNKDLTLRQNRSFGEVSAPLIRIDSYTVEEQQHNIEVCYNNGYSSKSAFYIGNNPSGAGLIWSYRNTWQGYIKIGRQNQEDGPFYFERDVLLHTGKYPQGFFFNKSTPSTVIKSQLFNNTFKGKKLIDQTHKNQPGIYGHEISP